MITKNYYFKSRFRTLNCVRTTYLVNKKFQTTNNLCYCRCMSTTQLICRTARVTVLVCQGHNLCFSNNNSYHCCCLSITQLMSEAKLVLLLNFNNTTYVSNNSCHCCCMSTTQFVSNNSCLRCCFSTNYNLCVKQLVSLLLFAQQRSSLFQTAPRLMLIVFVSFLSSVSNNNVD